MSEDLIEQIEHLSTTNAQLELDLEDTRASKRAVTAENIEWQRQKGELMTLLDRAIIALKAVDRELNQLSKKLHGQET